MNDELELQLAGFKRPLTREQLRAWLDRKPPPGSWRDRKPSNDRLGLQLKEALVDAE